MPQGKPAGVRCLHLTDDQRCDLFGDPRRPVVCGTLQPRIEMCGDNREQALIYLTRLERMTQPDVVSTS